MPWLQLRLHTTEPHADQIGDALMEIGALSVTLMDAEDIPILEPAPGETPLWQNVAMLALFDADTDTNEILATWQQHNLAQYSSNERFELLEDKDWEREWMTHFEPIQFGNQLWVCPSWKPIPDESAVNIMLDPGLAFGTGTHPTTALCLEWLDGADLKDKVVIDYGCGSGILAIAALKLGASKAYAVDIDPQAIIATKENAKRNGINDEQIEVGMPVLLAEQSIKVDIVIANILAGPLKELAEDLAFYCQSHGKIMLSGLLLEQAESVSAAYLPWFKLDEIHNKEEWIRLIATKTGFEQNI
jgi:ribosomal protein L11 methyltransferase